jgi:hypothetical protein
MQVIHKYDQELPGLYTEHNSIKVITVIFILQATYFNYEMKH